MCFVFGFILIGWDVVWDVLVVVLFSNVNEVVVKGVIFDNIWLKSLSMI